MANKYKAIVEHLGGRKASPRPAEEFIPTVEELDRLQADVGYSLPADYLDFLQDYGLYGFSNPVYPVVGKGSGGMETLSMFYSACGKEGTVIDIYPSAPEHFDLLEADLYPGLRLVRNIGPEEEIGWPPELLPIGCDQGGNQICLALFGLRPGAIFWWRSAPFENADNVYLVADSFDEFMHLLRKDE